MSVLSAGMVGASGVDTGDITKSLRFRASGSTYLSKAGTSSSTTKLSISFWIKRGLLGAAQTIWNGGPTGANQGDYFGFNSSDNFEFIYDDGVNTVGPYATTAVYRDPTSHMHVLVVWDTTQATQADRLKLYIGGNQVTVSNGLALNALIYCSYSTTVFGRRFSAGDRYLDGYLSRIAYVVGAAQTPSDFGYLNTEINEWVTKSRSACKAVVDAGGTNSFMLEFDDGASLTALGYSKSRPYEASNFTDIFTNVTKVDNGDGTWRWTFGNVTSLMRLSGLSNPGSGVPITVSFRVRRVSGGSTFPIDFGDQGPTDVFSELTLNTWVVVTKTFTTNGSGAFVDFPNDGNHNGLVLDVDYVSISHQSNWTLTNHSITAGTSYDWMEDRPGNSYAVLNPLKTTVVPTNANLYVTANSVYGSRGSMAVAAGKWYWEVDVVTDTAWSRVGVLPADIAGNIDAGYTSSSSTTYENTGQKGLNGTNSAYGSSWVAGDLLGVALDCDGNTVTFYKNEVSQGAITLFTSAGTTLVPMVMDDNNGGSVFSLNFGQAPLRASATYHSAAGGYFRHAPPTGFKALCQSNLPEGAVRNPKAHFDVNLRTGTGASFSVTGKSLAPDLVWVKERSGADGHRIFSRGLTHAYTYIDSSATAAETNNSNNLTSFNSDGFSGGSGLGTTGFNDNTYTYVDWLWKANGAAVSNTNGTITSQVSANQTAGFSIVTYTSPGSASDQTVGHGLGVAPKLIIAKNRDAAINWDVWHTDLTNNDYGLILNSTAAQASGRWTTTAPTSTVFSTKNTYEHQNTERYVAYCFAEIAGFSKIGSYTGNGSVDGPFCFTGFKPRYLLWKRSDAVGDWIVHDSARATYNADDTNLYPNLAGAESVGGGYPFDMTSNGFKVRNSATYANASGGTYIFLAIADTNGRYSNAR